MDGKGNVITKNSEGYWVYVAVENGKKIITNQIVTKSSVPININRDSIFNYIREKRTASYLRKSVYHKTRAGGSNCELHPIPSKGNRKILTVLVEFPDVHFQNTTGIKTIISNMMNQENYRHIGQSRITGSVYDYFRQASYNQLKLQSTVIGPYTVSKPSFYSCCILKMNIWKFH